MKGGERTSKPRTTEKQFKAGSGVLPRKVDRRSPKQHPKVLQEDFITSHSAFQVLRGNQHERNGFRMSDFTKDIFARMDLQQIREFLLHGVDDYNQTGKPYHLRIKDGSDAIYKRLGATYQDGEALDAANADLCQALSNYESVYMEIGMKAGARILYQLLVAEQ